MNGWHRKVIWTSVLLVAGVLSGYSAVPSYYDMTLPVPVTYPAFTLRSGLHLTPRGEAIPVVLSLDSKGAVQTVRPEVPSDSLYVAPLTPWLRGFSFLPAKRANKNVAVQLPVVLMTQPRKRQPEVIFPVDSLGKVRDADLYFHAYSLNGIRSPRLEKFPRYYCDAKADDTAKLYRYILAKVSLDTTGSVAGIEVVQSTYPQFTQQITSAILWAEFSPASVNDSLQPSTGYLLVSFFPHVSYPTREWRRSALDSMNVLERCRVRLLPDTVGLLSPPIPVLAPGDEYTLAGTHAFLHDTVSAVVSVNKGGKATASFISSTNPMLRQAVMKLVRRLAFYPALDFEGEPHFYSGLVHFIFEGSSKVRIEYHWLKLGKYF